MDDFSFEKYWNSSLRFLSYRPRSEKEVKDNLVKKQATAEIIEKIITKLRDYKFINDTEFAKWFIEQRTNMKPKAQRVLRMELKQRGISQDIIENSVFGQDLESARKLLTKKFDRYKDLNREQIYQKLGGFLARRGYSWDTIKKAIDPDSIGVDEGIDKRV